MSTIVTRQTGVSAKNSPLTNTELDTNFINLNNDKLENITTTTVAGGLPAFNDTAGKILRAATSTEVALAGNNAALGNSSITYQFALTSAASKGLAIVESAASTSGSSVQDLFRITSLGGSTANLITAYAQGTGVFQIDDYGSLSVFSRVGVPVQTVTIRSGTTSDGTNGGAIAITSGDQSVNGGVSGTVTLSSGTSAVSSSGGVTIATGTSSGFSAGAINITGGNSSSGGGGGSINLTGGTSSTLGGTAGQNLGGLINITGGISQNTQSGNSGGVVIKGGAAGAVASVAGGPVVITGGAGSTTTTGGIGGAVTINGGTGGLALAGGDVLIAGGIGGATGNGGAITVRSGNAGASGGAAGTTTITCGSRSAAGDGAAINITATSAVTSGTGGTVTITSGTGFTAGGNIAVVTGTATSANNRGKFTYDGNEVGFRQIPQNSQSIAYTTVMADGGKHIYHPSADTTARVFTIDSNANVPYPIGTAITFVNATGAGTVTISIATDTMYLAGVGTTGSRTLVANGIATALKITATTWVISGTGLS